MNYSVIEMSDYENINIIKWIKSLIKSARICDRRRVIMRKCECGKYWWNVPCCIICANIRSCRGGVGVGSKVSNSSVDSDWHWHSFHVRRPAKDWGQATCLGDGAIWEQNPQNTNGGTNMEIIFSKHNNVLFYLTKIKKILASHIAIQWK